VDTDVHEACVDTYNIQGLPLFAVFKEGKMVGPTHSGAMTKDQLRKFVEKAIQ
jgi:thioredoxin-like negative regulator of GroEL